MLQILKNASLKREILLTGGKKMTNGHVLVMLWVSETRLIWPGSLLCSGGNPLKNQQNFVDYLGWASRLWPETPMLSLPIR